MADLTKETNEFTKYIAKLNKLLQDSNNILFHTNDADQKLVESKRELIKRIQVFEKKEEELENKKLVQEGKELLRKQDFYRKETKIISDHLNRNELFNKEFDLSNRNQLELFKKQVEYQRADVDFQKKKIKESRDLWHKEKGVTGRGKSFVKGSIANAMEGFFKDNDFGKIINFGSKLLSGRDLSETRVKGEKKLERDEKIISDATHIYQQEDRLKEAAKTKQEIEYERVGFKETDKLISDLQDMVGTKVNEDAKKRITSNILSNNVRKVKERKRVSALSSTSSIGPSGWVIDSRFKTNARLFGYESEIGRSWFKKPTEASLRKDGLRDKVGKEKNFFKDNKGGLLGMLAGLAGLVGLGGLLGFVLTGKSEYLGTMIKGFVKGGMLLTQAVTLPFKVAKTITERLGVKLAGKVGDEAIKKAGGKVATKAVGHVARQAAKKAGKKTLKKIGSKAAETGIKSVAKRLGLSVLKKIPGVGLLISIPLAINRFRKGDFIGGLLELASGGASIIPGIGTALSIAIDAFSLFRDVKNDMSSPQEPPPLPKTEKGALKKMVTGKDIEIEKAQQKSEKIEVKKEDDNSIKIKVDSTDNKKDEMIKELISSITSTLTSPEYAENLAKANWKEAKKSGIFRTVGTGSSSGGL